MQKLRFLFRLSSMLKKKLRSVLVMDPSAAQTGCSAELKDPTSPLSVSDLLSTKGWALFDVNHLELTDEEAAAARDWETIFDTAFSQNQAEKESAGLYRVEQGVSVGYRVDSEREFFETRLTSSSNPEPNFPSVNKYATTARCLYSIFSKIGVCCIEDIADKIGLDPQCFIDLTDLDNAGILPDSPPSKTSVDFGKKELVFTLSSSLLRICKYKSEDCEEVDDPSSPVVERTSLQEETQAPPSLPLPPVPPAPSANPVWFGAHTDSSFLTISLCSTTPGLEIVDQESNKWVCPEKLQTMRRSPPLASDVNATENAQNELPAGLDKQKRYAIVFVGEFLQVLTKNRFRAAVHRVKNFSADRIPAIHTNISQSVPSSSSASLSGLSEATGVLTRDASTRISCPFIIRGRNSALIDLHNTDRYCHPGGCEALAEDKVPNLDGTNMHLMHKLLDLKRQKCFRENGSAEGASWVLSAYPVPPLPEEE